KQDQTRISCTDPTLLWLPPYLPRSTFILPRLSEFKPRCNRGSGDDDRVVTAFGEHVEPALHDFHGHCPARQARLHLRGIHLVRLLDADRDFDVELARIEPERAHDAQRRMVERVLHRAQRGLRVIGAVQVVAGSHLQDDTLQHALRSVIRNGLWVMGYGLWVMG